MSQMNISNTLFNDTSTGELAYVEQLTDRLLKNYISTLSSTDKSRIAAKGTELGFTINDTTNEFQDKLNKFFLNHWVEYQRFLLDEGLDPDTIDSWKEIQDFLEGLPDDETMWLKNQLQRLDNRITAMDIPDGGAYDVSADHVDGGGNYATYADLSTALAAISTDDRKSGMSIRFINSTTNKYEQWRYMLEYANTTAGNTAFTTVSNWQGIDDEPTTGSNNLVKSGGVANKLSLLKSVLGVDLINLTETLTWNDGYVISRRVVAPSSGFSYSDPILLPKGTAINFSSSENIYSTTNQLTKAIINGEDITYFALLFPTSTWKSFFYILTEDTYVVFNKRNDATTKIVSLSSDAYSRLQEIMNKKDLVVLENIAAVNTNIKEFLGTNFNNLTSELTWNTGRIQGSTVNTSTNYKYSNPTFLPKGTVISYTGSAGGVLSSNTNAVTEAIIDGENISYKSLLNLSSNWYKYDYVLEKDAYIVFNIRGSEDDTAIISFGSDFLMSLLSITIPSVSKLNEIKDLLGTDLIEKSVDLVWANTGSIRGSSINTNSSYRYTNPIFLTKGTIIRFEVSTNLNSVINALTKATVVEGSVTAYERLYGFTYNWKKFEYVLTEDCYVVFNRNVSYEPTISIYSSNSLAGIWNALPGEVEKLPSVTKKSELNEVIGTENLENILDSLNLTWTNGRYVYYNRGTSVANNQVRVFNEPTGSYCYSNIFKVTKGTIIQWNQNASAFGRLNVPIVGFVVVGDDVSTATNRYGLLKLDANTSSSFRWTAPDDLYISICVRNDAYTSEYLKIYKSAIGADTIQTTLDSYVKFPKVDYMDLMSQATMVDTYNGTNSEFGSGYERTQVTLLHFSDIHNDIPRIFRVLNFNSKYNTIDHYIDGIIMTGDLVGEKYGVFDDAYYQTIPNFNKVMLAIGNHDVYDADDLYSRPGICSTAAGTAAKEVDVTYGTDRTVFTVKMNNVNTATNPTLNISGTGAKPLYYNGSAASSSNSWSAGSTLVVVDNETYYDSYSQGYDSVYLRATEKQKYDRYMANISSWGVVQPTGAGQNNYYPCYYYKDYTTNRVDTESPNARYNQNVRLIVVDATIQSGTEDYTTQLNWFTNVLADANTNGLHVVVAEHYALRTSFASTNHMRAGGFDCLIDEWGENPAGSRLNSFCNAVDSFITEGGNFVCWLCGHFHWDMVGTTTQYPKQLFIAVGSADTVSPMQHRARIVGEQSEDLFNIVAIDTFRKHIRVFRVGAQFDRFLQHAGTMCISYDTTGNNVPTLLSCW